MKRANSFFTDAERDQIEACVREAESKTSAEVVVAVATASGRYDRAEDIAGLWCGLIALVIAYFALPFPQDIPDWGFSILHVRWLILAGAVLVGFIAGAALATYWLDLRRLFTPAKQMKEEAALRARQVFYDTRVHHTAGASGLLIFLSLYEHQTVLLADNAVLKALPSGMLNDLCRSITQGLKEGRGVDAICDAIREAGDRLLHELPRAENDIDELANRVVILD